MFIIIPSLSSLTKPLAVWHLASQWWYSHEKDRHEPT